MKIVEIKKLFFQYFDKKILFDINLEIEENEKIILIGSNGAGKSTLLRVLCGLHMATNYEHFEVLGDRSPNDQCNGLCYLGNRWERNISFCGVSPYMGDIRAGDMMKKWQEDNIERRNELVEVLEIDLDWKMHQVSDGQRKRVQIMLGLLKPFKLLVIDEFLNELDVVIRDNFFKYLEKECKLRNSSIIYATHIFDNLDKWADKVIYISKGKCENKIYMNKFNTCNNLFKSVKKKMVEDKNRCKEKIELIDPLKFGPQHGYDSGRSSNLKI
tara:strand:- start:710 stop:1522 length:813 start_codon:yes stop_codon:yes gene_type:complete